MRKRSGLSRTQFLVQWVVLPVLVIVSAAMFVGLVRNQVSIAAKQQELQSLREPAGGTGHGKCRAVRHARPG